MYPLVDKLCIVSFHLSSVLNAKTNNSSNLSHCSLVFVNELIALPSSSCLPKIPADVLSCMLVFTRFSDLLRTRFFFLYYVLIHKTLQLNKGVLYIF